MENSAYYKSSNGAAEDKTKTEDKKSFTDELLEGVKSEHKKLQSEENDENSTGDNIYKTYQNESLTKYKGLEDSAYYKSLKERTEGIETTPEEEKKKRAEKEEKFRSFREDSEAETAYQLDNESIEKLKARAANGNTDAMNQLGVYYSVEQKDKAAAHAWFRKAEKSGDVDAKLLRETIEGKRTVAACEFGYLDNSNKQPAYVCGVGRNKDDNRYSYSWRKEAMTPEEQEEAERIYQEISQ